jgi:hypothetical protein
MTYERNKHIMSYVTKPVTGTQLTKLINSIGKDSATMRDRIQSAIIQCLIQVEKDNFDHATKLVNALTNTGINKSHITAYILAHSPSRLVTVEKGKLAKKFKKDKPIFNSATGIETHTPIALNIVGAEETPFYTWAKGNIEKPAFTQEAATKRMANLLKAIDGMASQDRAATLAGLQTLLDSQETPLALVG